MNNLRLSLLLLLLNTGCIRTAVVQFWEPASVDVSSMNRIVVMDFEGEKGEAISSVLTDELEKNNFYTVVDHSSLSNGLLQASYTLGSPDRGALDDVLSAARVKGIDGIVLGEVQEYHYENRKVRRLISKTSLERNPFQAVDVESSVDETDAREQSICDAKVTISFRLVDVKTGDVRAEKEVTKTHQLEIGSGLTAGTSEDEVLRSLTDKCVSEIVVMLAPHPVVAEFQLANCDVWTRGRREVREGNRLAHLGEWERAELMWQKAIELEPDNHAAHFNLAVSADHRQEYSKAEEYAMQAIRLQHKPVYASGLNLIRQHRSATEKSTEQHNSRIAVVDEVAFW
ncbi:CsgG/HfaB family protein [Planctomicrobium sp. SH668]|uniref:CsgG/HfaB family protein n=1 Tax=Planctomicrobium sp. SH668 TaxID=3448126 RepID=UPI003F5BCE36